MLLGCFVILSKNLVKWETVTVQLINAKNLTGVLMGVLKGQQGPLASQPWSCYITITEMLCSWRGLLTLLCLFSFWQFFSLSEQEILYRTKEVVSVMSLRCANYKRDLLLRVSISFPAMKTSAGWLLRATLPCLLLPRICDGFELTSETIGDELSESLGFFFSSLTCIALILSSSPGNL